MNSSSMLYRDFMAKVWRPALFLLVAVAVAGVPSESDAGRKRTNAQKKQSDWISFRDQDRDVHDRSESKREFKELYEKVNNAITQLIKNNNDNNLDFEALQRAAEQADLEQMQAVDRFNDAAKLHGEKNTVVTLQAVNQAIQGVVTANQNKTAVDTSGVRL